MKVIFKKLQIKGLNNVAPCTVPDHAEPDFLSACIVKSGPGDFGKVVGVALADS